MFWLIWGFLSFFSLIVWPFIIRLFYVKGLNFKEESVLDFNLLLMFTLIFAPYLLFKIAWFDWSLMAYAFIYMFWFLPYVIWLCILYLSVKNLKEKNIENWREENAGINKWMFFVLSFLPPIFWLLLLFVL